jgi:hypothetical protein
VPAAGTLLDSTSQGLATRPARAVYCQRLGQKKFAVGLQLEMRVENWQKPPKRRWRQETWFTRSSSLVRVESHCGHRHRRKALFCVPVSTRYIG